MIKEEMIELLAKYRRPGSPTYGHHFRNLPAEVVQKRNVSMLLDILEDGSLPFRVREHAAGALGEIGDERAVASLINALGERHIRRGAAVALGRMKAKAAAKALKELAPRLKAARWALSELGMTGSVEEVIEGLREGQLRQIRPIVGKLSAAQRRTLSQRVRRGLQEVVANGRLAPDHRWLVTTLQYLAPPEAGNLIARALRQSIHLKSCPGGQGLRKRLIRAAGAVRPLQAIPVLADVICLVDNPAHKQLAAVCIEKILQTGGPEALALVRDERARLSRELARLEKSLQRIKHPGATHRAAVALTRLLQRSRV